MRRSLVGKFSFLVIFFVFFISVFSLDVDAFTPVQMTELTGVPPDYIYRFGVEACQTQLKTCIGLQFNCLNRGDDNVWRDSVRSCDDDFATLAYLCAYRAKCDEGRGVFVTHKVKDAATNANIFGAWMRYFIRDTNVELISGAIPASGSRLLFINRDWGNVDLEISADGYETFSELTDVNTYQGGSTLTWTLNAEPCGDGSCDPGETNCCQDCGCPGIQICSAGGTFCYEPVCGDNDNICPAGCTNPPDIDCTQTCTWGGWSACSGCTPTECTSCSGTQTRTDDCGNTESRSCTTPAAGCPAGKECISGSCQPICISCADAGYNCGSFINNCGEVLNCGLISCGDGNPCTQGSCSSNICQQTFLGVGAFCPGGVCDGAGSCIQCVNDNDCPGILRCSDSFECVECEFSSHCTDPDKPVCSAFGTCVECGDSDDCGEGLVCSASNTCVTCNDDTDCDDGNECTVDSCIGDVDGNICDFQFVESGEVCNEGAGLCDGGGICVECRSDDDCGEVNEECIANECVVVGCGDGVVSPGETCDFGDGVIIYAGDKDSCGDYDAFTDGNLDCFGLGDPRECQVNTINCEGISGVCGNGNINLGETCDCGDDEICSDDEINFESCENLFGTDYTGNIGCFDSTSVNECLIDTGQCHLKGACFIEEVYWSNGRDELNDGTEVEEDNPVLMVVEGTSGCTIDDNVNIKIFRTINPLFSVEAYEEVGFTDDGQVLLFWLAERHCTLGCILGNPKFYFTATYQDDSTIPSENIVVKVSDGIPDCGDGFLEIGEVCDVGFDEDPGDDILPGGKSDCSEHRFEDDEGDRFDWTSGVLKCKFGTQCTEIDTSDCECIDCQDE